MRIEKIRLGLCCIFQVQPIHFRQTTAALLKKIPREKQLDKLSDICLGNLVSLEDALKWVSTNGIGAFRILSPLFPRMTHPDVGYSVSDLPDSEKIEKKCRTIKEYARKHDIRLSLHPDQFNVLSSPHAEVVRSTLEELEYHGMLADRLGIEVINIHGGGTYGDINSAKNRFLKNFEKLSDSVKSRIAVENDDRSYSPQDLFPLCYDLDIPFTYDVHHHRCLPDGFTVEEATEKTLKIWQKYGKEPYFHLSSSKNGYDSKRPGPHADFISVEDFPDNWQNISFTLDIEAKAKELAVLKFKSELEKMSE